MSAGTQPATSVHPEVAEVMREIGIHIEFGSPPEAPRRTGSLCFHARYDGMWGNVPIHSRAENNRLVAARFERTVS
jgi:hypothetical protein